MGQITHCPQVKLIIGFIFKDEDVFVKARRVLCRLYGKIDFESSEIAFTYTGYYENELGKGLKRKFISFQKLIPPSILPAIKIKSNKIEKKFSLKGRRSINIDPGYLDLSKLVLATTKDYKHRIYLDKGIFAEITLFYQGRSFSRWEWTYPDYQSTEYIEVFNQIREIYHQQIKNG